MDCPFAIDFDVDCVYMGEGGTCDDVEINFRNGDAWCFQMTLERDENE